MYSLLSWLIIGLTIGLIARMIVPHWKPIGVGMTIVLSILGAMFGGLVSTQIWTTFAVNEPDVSRMWPGWLMSAASATFLLWFHVVYNTRPVWTRR